MIVKCETTMQRETSNIFFTKQELIEWLTQLPDNVQITHKPHNNFANVILLSATWHEER